MKTVILLIIFFLLLGFTTYEALKPDSALREDVTKLFPKIGKMLEEKSAQIAFGTGGVKDAEVVVLYFKNGKTMIGELLEEGKDTYTLNWKGRETIIYREFVERIGEKNEISEEKKVLTDEEVTQWWPYQNDVVIRQTNRIILDAPITRITDKEVTIVYEIAGGRMEQDIKRAKVEYLLFKPVANAQSKTIETTLKSKFPQMKRHKIGNITIFTDSHDSWCDEYKKTLKFASTNVYFKFHELFKERAPETQNFVVIFDSYLDFVRHAVKNGIPGWAIAGYFHPDERVLYLFNSLGDGFSEILFEAMVGESNRSIDDIVEVIEGQVDRRYHIFIEGQAKKIKNKFWDAYIYYKGLYRRSTEQTLRHEFTHGIFHNWGLQSVTVSKFSEASDSELAKGKEAIIASDDFKEKAELVKGLISFSDEPIQMQAANSWLAEGLATYTETDPIGKLNDRWLYLYQDMVEHGAIYPLSALTGYKMGSFPGVCSQAQQHLYAQSWALVMFFMEKYPGEFISYQNRIAQERTAEYDDMNWLFEAIGKDEKTIEGEFTGYMAGFEQVDDPFTSSFVKLYEIFNSIY